MNGLDCIHLQSKNIVLDGELSLILLLISFILTSFFYLLVQDLDFHPPFLLPIVNM